jgi:hypothetical protein
MGKFKISKELEIYPFSRYGGTRETEIYKMGFMRAVQIAKSLEKNKKKKKK